MYYDLVISSGHTALAYHTADSKEIVVRQTLIGIAMVPEKFCCRIFASPLLQ